MLKQKVPWGATSFRCMAEMTELDVWGQVSTYIKVVLSQIFQEMWGMQILSDDFLFRH